jgi:anti-sigma-K factor RskA
MNGHDPEVHSLLGPYVLDALEPAERAAYESHLRVCGACRAEVADLRPAAAALADRPLAPPPELRARVLRIAAGTQPVRRPGPRVSRRRLAVVAAAAAVIVAVGGGVVVSQRDQPMTAEQVFAAADVRTHDMPTTMGEVRVAMSHEMHMVAVDGSAMTDPGAGMAYQVWWSAPGHTEPVAMFQEAESVVVPVGEGDLLITMEPMTGSSKPSAPPLLSMPVTSL